MSVPEFLFPATSTTGSEENVSYVVGPDWAVIAWTVGLLVWACVALTCAWLLVRKRRWGWLVLGALTGGVGWVAGPFVAPAPDGPWTRRAAR